MKYKILELLKSESGFISGEEIGRILNISRSAVWKNISKLKEFGYNITSSTNKGYHIEDLSNVINDYELKSAINTKVFGKNFICLKETDSTNEEAKRQAQKGVDEGFLVISERQTKGKGRLGHIWTHSNSLNLAFSIVLKPKLIPQDITALTLIAGLSVCSALTETGVKAYVKWPNDIIINGKKAVGILTEISCEIERINYVVIGIGINVNEKSFDDELKEKATSLFIETGKIFKKAEILNLVLQKFEENYYLFMEKGDFKPFIEKYKSLCINMGKEIKAFSKKDVITGVVSDISEKGELVVKNTENNSVSLVSGEVSVRLKDGRYI